MTAAAWFLVGREMRRGWRANLALAFVIGLVGAVVLTTLAGARRTDSAYDRLQQIIRSADASVEVSPEYFDAIAALPQVEGVAPASYFFVFPDGTDGDMLTIAGVDERFSSEVDRPFILDGRIPEADEAHDVVLNPAAADALGVDVGDAVSLSSLTPEQLEQLIEGGDPGEPEGPDIEVTVAGIGRTEEELATGLAIMGFTPAFFDTYRDEVGHFDDILQVRLKHGAADLPAFQTAVAEVVPDSEGVIVESQESTKREIDDAMRVLAVSLMLFALIVALAGFIAIAQAIARRVALRSDDQVVMQALGMSRAERVVTLGVPVTAVAVIGALLAAVLAVLASPLMPIGYARRVEPDLGLHVDWFVMTIGLVVIASVVAARAALSTWRATSLRSGVYAGGNRVAVPRVLQFGSVLPLTLGARMALDPGRGPRAVPVRAAIAGAIAGVAGLVAALTFGAGLGWTTSNRDAFGLTWDTSVADDSGTQSVADEVETLAGDPDVDAVAALAVEPIRVRGTPIQAYGFDDNGFVVVHAGRVPRAADEVLMGSKTLDRLDLGIGDTVEVSGFEGGGATELRVVGRGVFPEIVNPSVPDSDAGAYNDFAMLTEAGFGSVEGERGDLGFDVALVRWAPGVDIDAAAGQLAEAGWATQTLDEPHAFTNLRRVDNFPQILAVFLVLIAVVAVGHTLLTFVRRRQRDLAMLRSFGFSRRQVRASVAWQATTLIVLGLVVGIPLGLVMGRFAWGIVADNLGVALHVPVPWLVVVAIIPAALLVANAVAAVPAWRAARTRPAVVLRSE